LWKKGIRHGDISLENLMWDDRRKVGILNDFDLAKFTDQAGASGKDNTGTLPFMALDLLSEEGLHGKIPRHYRHEAESFTWTLICLCLSTVEDKDGRNYTPHPHPLNEWFQGWKISRDAKKGLEWRDHKTDGVPLVHPKARTLASALHRYWADRYARQFPHPYKDDGEPSSIATAFDIMDSTKKDPPYEEPEDDRVFQELLVRHEKALHAGSLEETKDDLIKMSLKFREIDWNSQSASLRLVES
jgi:serine/threonine protein kinase